MQEVIVVGAGIIGAATAYFLQTAGSKVTLIDSNHSNATASSFGWINASFFENPDHFRLRLEGIAAYRKLGTSLSLPINWSGCLCWENSGDAFEAQLDELKELRYEVEEIDSFTFSKLEPNISNPPDRCLYFKDEAAAESAELAKTLLNTALERGARLLNGFEVLGFETKGDRVVGVATNVGTLFADEVLLAAGTATQKLASTIGCSIPMLERPALMVKTRPVDTTIKHILVSDIGEVRQLPNGSILMPTTVGHQSDRAAEIQQDPSVLAQLAMERLSELLPSLQLEVEQLSLAFRPVPKDGLPVVGAIAPGLYTATMHSGITLGALMGDLVAQEIRNGITNHTGQWLSPYRPERFATKHDL